MLELVATMPSMPLAAGVALTLDMLCRSVRWITVAEPRWEREERNFMLYAKKRVPSKMRLVSSNREGTCSDCGDQNKARSRRPDTKRSFTQNLLLQFFAQRQRPEFIKVFLNIRHARTRPVRAKQSLVGNLFEAGKVLEQGFRRDAADIEIDAGMAANQKKRCLHPQGTASVSQQNFKLREIDGHIVDVNRIAIFVARPRENRRSRVKHYRHAIGFRSTINNFQFLHSV